MPIFAHQELDLHKVFWEVQSKGGSQIVTDQKLWKVLLLAGSAGALLWCCVSAAVRIHGIGVLIASVVARLLSLLEMHSSSHLS